MNNKNDSKDSGSVAENKLSAKPADVESRISALVKAFGSRKEAANVADVSLAQLHRYISGESQPPFGVIARMATASGVRMEWIWSGEGPMFPEAGARRTGEKTLPGVTKSLILDVYDLLEHVIEEEGLNPTREQKARFLADMTAYMAIKEIDDATERRDLIKLVVSNG